MLLYTVKPKIDTKGHCYTLALQQILTGVYIAELCLIGLFSLRSATGPSIMMGLLFLTTIIFNYFTNRFFAPLEQYLPADLTLESQHQNEQTPLLSSAEQGEATSHIQSLTSRAHVPPKIAGPLARFFEPHIFASHAAMKQWLRDGDFDENDVPEYTEAQIKTAYLNPAYTSSTPVVWIPRDPMGVSKVAMRENEEAGIKCSDAGAWIDEEGALKWSVDDFEQVPVFKEGVRW